MVQQGNTSSFMVDVPASHYIVFRVGDNSSERAGYTYKSHHLMKKKNIMETYLVGGFNSFEKY